MSFWLIYWTMQLSLKEALASIRTKFPVRKKYSRLRYGSSSFYSNPVLNIVYSDLFRCVLL